MLAHFRRAVLTAACSGALTRDWREEYGGDEWEEIVLGDALLSKPRNGWSPKAVGYETNVKSLTFTATTSGVFKSQHFKYIDAEISPDSHLWLKEGDILIQRSNSLEHVGASAIYRGSERTYIYPDLMMKAEANEKALSEFL